MAKKSEISKKIDEISSVFGIKRRGRTIFDIKVCCDERVSKKEPINENLDQSKFSNTSDKILTLKSGSWKNATPWFGVDENDEIYTMMSLPNLNRFLGSYRNLARQNFDLRLEKSILKQIPIDFGDAWAVCIDKISQISNQDEGVAIFHIDLDKVVENVKLEHPNLFVNLNEITKR